MEEKDQVIEIFSGTLWEAEMITSLLKEEGIESFLKNSVLSTYAYNPVFSQDVKIMIFASDFERAKRIVNGYCVNRKRE